MWKQFQTEFKYFGVIVGGVAFGILVLLPLSEFASYLEYIEKGTTKGPVSFILGKLLDAITLNPPIRFIYYSGFGILCTVLFILITNRLKEKSDQINRLKNELNLGLLPLIAQGESNILEFKSSYRFDLNKNVINRTLEAVIMKTLAGFMNGEGGTLLIGVADDGTILGLENDYQTLKRKDKDGFEQLIMSSVAERMGTAACNNIRLVFHSCQQMEVSRILIDHSDFPVYVKDGNTKKFYLRTGSGTREMDIQEAINFITQNWRNSHR